MAAFHILRRDLLRYLRNPGRTALLFAIPLLMAGIFALVFGGGGEDGGITIRVLLWDEDSSLLGRLLQGAGDRPESEGRLEVVPVGQEGLEMMNHGDASALVHLPKGFTRAVIDGTPAAIEVIKNPAQRFLPLVVEEGVILEIVRPGTGEPLGSGEVGEVVITSFNRDYPLIRFATGDLSAVLPGRSPCGRTNVRIRGWMGRADQSTKVRAMFVTPGQVNDVRRRHPEVLRARLLVEGEAGNDRMTLHCEAKERPAGLAEAIVASIREVTKLRGEVLLAEPGSLPNDGKVIEDKRKYT